MFHEESKTSLPDFSNPIPQNVFSKNSGRLGGGELEIGHGRQEIQRELQ
jgi:hypothetical protein